jgi:hypothetical protein
MANRKGKKMDGRLIKVVDIPVGVSAEECERLLNAANTDAIAPDYYPFVVLSGEIAPGIAHRAIFRRYKLPSEKPVRKALEQYPDEDAARAAAIEIWRKERNMGINRMALHLQDRGFRRGSKWVTKLKNELHPRQR